MSLQTYQGLGVTCTNGRCFIYTEWGVGHQIGCHDFRSEKGMVGGSRQAVLGHSRQDDAFKGAMMP